MKSQFDVMHFCDFWFYKKSIEKEESEQQRNTMVAAAFVGWQLGNTGQSFDMYLNGFGLLEKEPPLTDDEKQFLTDRALEKAERIAEAMKNKPVEKIKVL